MNITDLIVELLQQGNTVEIPTIGTLRTEMQAAHHDPLTHTYYPARRVVAYSNVTAGSHDLVKQIAQRECVSEDIAEMMWNNYIGALSAKLQSEGSHTFEGIGILTKNGSSYSFAFNGTQNIDTTPAHEQPIEHINTYSPKNGADPFAAFDKQPVASQQKPQIEEVAEQDSHVIQTPKPVQEETSSNAAEPAPITTPKPIIPSTPVAKPDPKPEPTTVVSAIPEPAETEESKPQPPSSIKAPDAQTASTATPIAESNDTATETDTDTMMQQLNELPPAPPSTNEEESEKKKKIWPWLLILILLLLGAGAYYYFFIYKSATQAPVATSTDSTSSTLSIQTDSIDLGIMKNANMFTFSTDIIDYDEEDIEPISIEVRDYLNDYIAQFASSRHYTAATEALSDSITQYARIRLNSLLREPNYSVERFFPYDDYIHNYIYGDLKSSKAHRARVKVQSELMDYNALDPMLESIVAQLGLAEEAATATAPKAKAAEKEPTYSNVSYTSSSKKGFDVIAGFFTIKNHAARMASKLKDQGCDAYVITGTNGYYVSMGSANSRTGAEALYNHIKSWYSGDIVIRQW